MSKPFFDDGPVDQVPEGGNVVGATVLIVKVVSMLPDIAGEQWCHSLRERVSGIAFLQNMEFPLIIFCQPGPSGAKKCCSRFGKRIFKSSKVTKVPVNGPGKRTFGRFPAGRVKSPEIESMVPYLGGIIKNRP